MTMQIVSHRPPLDGWIVKQLPQHTSTEWIELRHIRPDDTSTRIERWHATGARESDTAQSLAAQIAYTAQVWSDQVQSGAQRFVVALVDSREQPLAQFLFRAAASGPALDGPSSSEPPNLVGITSQLMRHNEANLKATLGTTVRTIERLEAELDRKQVRIDQLEKRWMETLDTVEELQSRKAEREIAAVRALRREERKDTIMEKLGVLVPVALSKMMKSGGLPSSPDPALAALVKSIDGPQLTALSAQLRPEQQAALLSLVQSYATIEDDTQGHPEAPTGAQELGAAE